FHRLPELALDERLDEKREEVDGEERLDARRVLQEHRGNLVHGLQLLEALLEPRLSLVGFEDLLRGERAVIGNERVHAVGLLIVGNGGGIDRPLEVVAAVGDTAVCSVRSWPAATGLLKVVLGAHGAGGLHIAAYVEVLKDLLDLQINA